MTISESESVEFDLESLIYVLLWITRRFGVENGQVKVVKPKVFMDWIQDNAQGRITAHIHALQNAVSHEETLQYPSNAGLAEAHGKHERTIAELCLAITCHLHDKESETAVRIFKKELRRDRTNEVYIQELHKKFVNIINGNQVLRDSEGRLLDLPDTQWAILAARGLDCYLWVQMQLKKTNNAQ
ncbi:hypothetical protein BDY19DRAFT_909134 [Irpex rosettiformis]|uniref:Uncharacterized protein n=1 Tax=Irpex rosettiformis TaxID=378272 RepID=A0ACB8TTF2_9APHY|nr:hypothetical protein BDY19DRAFT_909134 [Irpex rosettiformis]